MGPHPAARKKTAVQPARRASAPTEAVPGPRRVAGNAVRKQRVPSESSPKRKWPPGRPFSAASFRSASCDRFAPTKFPGFRGSEVMAFLPSRFWLSACRPFHIPEVADRPAGRKVARPPEPAQGPAGWRR